MAVYVPSQEILEKYANILVNFALRGGKGIKKGDVVRLTASESAKPLYAELRRAVLKAGGHIIGNYLPDDEDRYNFSRDFFELANNEQLAFFPRQYAKGLINQIDHMITILSDTNPRALEGIDPIKIIASRKAMKPLRDWMDSKENQGKFSWTLALYGTPQMAQEANLSLEVYWQQIIAGCYLNEPDPIDKWKQTFTHIQKLAETLTQLAIDKMHIEGVDTDLWITIGKNRQWLGGRGANIPSFEIFTSPDWRGTEGIISFNQPLYYLGNIITGITLQFRQGKVVKAQATKNEPLLLEMIKVKNADKIGEFSLTDKRFSKIDKFMAETLYDENIGGPYGNTHIALGKSYHDSYAGNPAIVTTKQWQEWGFNDSAIHTDIISTTQRQVTAYLSNGDKRVIYKNGQFTL